MTTAILLAKRDMGKGWSSGRGGVNAGIDFQGEVSRFKLAVFSWKRLKKRWFLRLFDFLGFKNLERTFRKKVPAGFEKSGCEQAFQAAEEEGDERDGGKDQCGGEQESHAEDESQRDQDALDG